MTYLSIKPMTLQSPFTLSINIVIQIRLPRQDSWPRLVRHKPVQSLARRLRARNISVTFARYLGRTLTLEISATFLGVIKLEERDAVGTGTAAGGEIIGLSRSPDWIIPIA